MGIQTSNVKSVGELVGRVRSSSAERGLMWFRGQKDARWHLEPKIQRNARILGTTDHAYETNLTHRFRGRAPLLGAAMDTGRNAAWLQTMQHHGLPTRLLDWTRSPLVAAYFAVERAITHPQEEHPDAVIWCLSPHALNWSMTTPSDSVTPSIESGLARALVDGAFYGDESARQSAVARRWKWKSETAASVGARYDNSEPFAHASHLAVMASESDIRMVVQQGAFTVHSFRAPELDLVEGASRYLQKFEIPAGSVMEFAAQIEACGFGEAGIYPDLDHLSRELERRESGVGER